MKIKVCGMRESENISELIKLEPDFIGFIFYHKSERFVTSFPEIKIPSSIKKVGVFVNETLVNVTKTVKKHNLDAVQLHGDETPELIEKLQKYLLEYSRKISSLSHPIEIFKAFSVDDSFDFSITNSYQEACNYFLFDTKGKDFGGNGVKFDWGVLENYKGETPFLLSGGISKVDAKEIKKISHKAFVGIDINSGFEIQPALKNIKEIKEFKRNL